MNIIGIDPGLDGAICVMEHGEVRLYDVPTLEVRRGKKKKREYNLAEVTDIIRKTGATLQPFHFHVALEKVHSMPGQGVASMFSMGVGYGMWLGIISAYQIPYTLITPQAWKKEMMQGMGKEKDASRQRAIQLFPQIADQLKLKKHHGRADALLIAEYLNRSLIYKEI